MAYLNAPNLLGKLWTSRLPAIVTSFLPSGYLSLYLTLLSVLCLVSILSTVVHAIPYPNSIVMYNLGTLVICYVVYSYTQGTDVIGEQWRCVCMCEFKWKSFVPTSMKTV